MKAARGAARSSLVVLIAVAAAVLAFYLVAFYPGPLNFDAAYQWWQARGHETSNFNDVGMTWLWRLGDVFTSGPGFVFVLQLLLLWCGLILVAVSLPVRTVWRIGFVLIAALAPVVFVLFSAVVRDAVLAGVLCCALGIGTWRGRGTAGRASFALVTGLLLLAVLVRENALLAVLPLVLWTTQREFAQPLRGLFVGACIFGGICCASALAEHAVDRRVTVFPATALWDLAALSVATDEVLLPPASHDPGLTVEELRSAFAPYSNTVLFQRARMAQPFFAPEDPINKAIWRSWATAVLAHPGAYLAHRWRVTLGLFGSKEPEWPHELVYFSANTQYQDNPPLPAADGKLHDWFMGRFATLWASSVFAPWPYVLLAVVAGAAAWQRRGSPLADAALAAASSGLLYAAPLPLAAPSTELRYLGWTCLSAILATAMVVAAKASRVG